MSKVHRILLLGLMICFSQSRAIATESTVSLPEVAQMLAAAKPGDVIVVRDGIYRDQQLKWMVKGTAQRGVTVCAQHPGGVVITGKSSLQIAAEYLTVSGLYFRDGMPARREVINFGMDGRVAHNCRLTDIVIDNYNAPQRDEQHVYIMISGKNNRVDHCSLLNKLNIGVTLIVNLNGMDCLDNHHQIDHNYFGPREVYGSNGAETIRIGTSQQSYESSATTVSDNLFDHCSGEVEVISVKSCDNIIARNVLWECEGLVVLRHGKRNVVDNNLFFGNGYHNTGGVRIVDEGHQVINNTFYRLTGKHFFSALSIMNAVPNSLPNRYVQVRNVLIRGNQFIECANMELGTGCDEERTLAPKGIVFERNKIKGGNVTNPFILVDPNSDIQCKDNIIDIVGNTDFKGFTKNTVNIPELPSYAAIRKKVGPSWTIASAVDTEEHIIMLPANKVYELTKPYIVDKKIKIRGNGNIVRYASTISDNMITIVDGGSLDIDGVCFDGSLMEGKAQAISAIASKPAMLGSYVLSASNCSFRNFGESSCMAISGAKGSFANKVFITNCSFSDMSGSGIDFSAERDDKGRYNVETLFVKDCVFDRFLGVPVNIYRGGNDESTAGPTVTIENCQFSNCCNRQRGSVLRLIGPQKLSIINNNFRDSGRGGAVIRLDECISDDITIKQCDYTNSGCIVSNRNKFKKS